MIKMTFIKKEENETKVSITKKLMKNQLKETVKNPWTYAAMAAWGLEGVVNKKSMSQTARNTVLAGVATAVLDQGLGLILNRDLIKRTGED